MSEKTPNKGFVRFGPRVQPKEITQKLREKTVLREGVDNFSDEELRKIMENLGVAKNNLRDYSAKYRYHK